TLEQAIELCVETARGHLGEVRAISQLGVVRAQQGDLDEAERLYQDVLRRSGEEAGHTRSCTLIRLGDVRRERNDLAGAAALLEEGIRLDRRWGGALLHEGYLALG